MEENKEWRRPTSDEVKLIKRQVKISTDYIDSCNKIYKIVIIVCLVLISFAVWSLFKGKDPNARALLIINSVFVLLALISIIRGNLKKRFFLKSCEKEKFWVRDLVVVNKEFFIQPHNRRKRDDSFIIHANIVNSVEKGDKARRTYHTTETVYKHLSIGSRFLDARYDDALDGRPYLIIEQIWSVDQ